MSKSHFPGRVFMQPHFYPANLKRQSVSEGDLAAGLHDSEESDCESLAQERQYQLELQQRIRENEELVGLSSDELENDSLEEDSLEGTTLEEQEGAKCDTDRYTTGMQKNGSNGRKQQSLDKYFNLRYDPNWKNIKDVAEFSEAKKANQVPGRSSMEFSQDSFYLLSNSCPKEKNQEIAKSRDTFSAFDTEVLNFHEPNAMVSNDPFRLYVKGKEAEEDYHFQDSPSTYSSAFSLHIQDRPERTKKDFVAKNIQTLGLGTHAKNSYLQLHSKKQVAVLQEQVADTKAVDEEPVQNVLPFQNMKMDPEDKWYLKSQQLKDHQNKQPQRNKIKSNQSLKGRAFPRDDRQQLPGRPAKSKSRHHRHLQVSEFQTAPTQAAEQDNSSALQTWLCPNPSVGPGTTHLSNFPNSRPFANQNFVTSTYPLHLTLHKFSPEFMSPAYNSEEKYHHGPPNGLPHNQQHLYNHAILPFFPRDDSTNDQAHPNQRNNSSIYNVNFQELVKDQVSLQDCKRHIYVDKSYHNYAICSLWPSHSSTCSSPAAPCPASQLTKIMEQHHQEITHFTEAHLTDRHLFNLLPPVITQLESDSELNTERDGGSRVKISRSNSEGYLMEVEKQKQLKVNKKPYSSKAYMNLNVRLGGLGPDYEAIKEKKEKLKQQKEYAKQIKEHNMKNTASVQRLPTKPKVTCSVSRQKALEYAKKIPRPKTFEKRQPDEEVKDERVLSQILRRDHLPQIASLETLQDRHEKEKQVVAAFRTLHIL